MSPAHQAREACLLPRHLAAVVAAFHIAAQHAPHMNPQIAGVGIGSVYLCVCERIGKR